MLSVDFSASPQKVLLGNYPTHVSLADLDGDGDRDLVSANNPSGEPGNSVSVVWNLGKGAFSPPLVLQVGEGPRSVEPADLNGDGKLDLVSANMASGSLSLLFNKGNGEFEAERRIGAPTPYSIASADLDGDLDIDLVASTSDRLVVFLNQGGGESFKPRLYGGGPPALADLDGDGDVDLVAPSGLNLISYLNLGDGIFAGPSLVGMGSEQRVVFAGDLDLDGDPDLVAGDEMSLSVLFNQGNGTFGPPRRYEKAGPALVEDLDSDGDPDMLVYDYHGTFRTIVLDNDGRGTFTDGAVLERYLFGVFPTAGDIDGDGHLDLVGAGLQGILVYSGNGDGTFGLPRGHPARYEPVSLIAGDFDGDEVPDLALGGYRFLLVLGNEGTGAFRRLVSLEREGTNLTPGDFDGDGRLDLAAVTGLREVSVFPNPGDGRLDASIDIPLGSEVSSLAAGDFDGDGHLDLAAAGEALAVLVNNGFGNLMEGETIPLADGVRSLVAGDLNGDGFPDLAALHPDSNTVLCFLNQPGGKFLEPRKITVRKDPQSVAAADLDGDGVLDLAVAYNGFRDPEGNRYIRSGVMVLLNQGDATFLSDWNVAFGNGPGSLKTVDLDGDGAQDLVVPFFNSQEVWARLNRGNATFPVSKSIGFGPQEGPLHVATADFDGDGRVDMAVADANSGTLTIQRNETLPPRSADLDRDSIPDECETAPFHRGDPDGDGALELSDPVFIIEHLFLAGPPPSCREAADTDDDGRIELTDAILLLGHLFLSGPPPAAPGPPGSPCGPDAAGSPGDLGCAAYAGC